MLDDAFLKFRIIMKNNSYYVGPVYMSSGRQLTWVSSPIQVSLFQSHFYECLLDNKIQPSLEGDPSNPS